jgi:O-antigen/teichoic acid export membrane protein
MSLSHSTLPAGAASQSIPPRLGFRHILRGAFWNWTDFVVGAAVAFFLSPFVVHHLGNVFYGIWVLINSLVSYMALVDLGMRGTVVRFLSADRTRGHHEEASRVVSGALWFRLLVCIVILCGTSVACLFATRAFHIPAETQRAARWAILLCGASLAVSLLFGIFGGVLNALHRFDLLSAVGITRTALNGCGMVVLLQRGGGIVAIATWQFFVAIVTGTMQYIWALRTYPELKLQLRIPDRELLQRFWSYSALLFIIAISGQVIYYTDNIVIGAVLPITAVTLYAIGFAPTMYLQQIVSSLSVTLLPAASGLEARGDWDQLRQLLFKGTRAVMMVALPIEVALFFRGGTFIRLWMGPSYAEPSGRVLRILLIMWFFVTANWCSGNIILGLSKHKPFAKWRIWEAIANLGLSIVLIHRLGIEGVAWGSVLPSLLVNGFLWPRYITKTLRVPLWHYVWQSWVRPALCVIPFAVACFLSEKGWPALHMWNFMTQIGCILPIFLFGFGVGYRKELIIYVSKKWPKLLFMAPGNSA